VVVRDNLSAPIPCKIVITSRQGFGNTAAPCPAVLVEFAAPAAG
jgi:hypothetical protein